MATPSPGAALLALATPFVLVHTSYLPSVSLGSADVDIVLSDLVLLVVAVAVAAALVRHGVPRPGRSRTLWLVAGAFLAWIVAETAIPVLADRTYDAAAHAVTAGKFLEYAVLALAVPVLARRRPERELLLFVVVGWSCLAALVGLAQFVGLDVFDAWAAGRRQPSFLGHHDFATLAGCAYAIGMSLLVFGRHARVALAACAAGAIGLVVSGSVAGQLGIVLALAAAAVAARRLRVPLRRLAGAAAGVAVVGVLIVAIRGDDLNDFLRFAGVLDERREQEAVETYSHRTLLAYLGIRIYLDHPVLGAGWQSSREYSLVSTYFPDARNRFPDVPAEAYPRPDYGFGVQNAWIQSLSDLGVPGFALFAGLFGLAAWLGVATTARRRSVVALAGTGLVLVTAAVWTAQGLTPGLALDTLTWLGIGLVAAEAADG